MSNKISGIALKESLREDLPDFIEVVKTEQWKVANASGGQPSIWTAVFFEFDDSQALSAADFFKVVLREGPWYTNFSAYGDVFVIFPGQVFNYRKGDTSGRDAAINYGRSINIPDSQLDWAE